MKPIFRHGMKFQMKMFAVYAAFGILISVVVGGIYYHVSNESFKEREYQNLNAAVRQSINQYNDLLQSMEDVSRYLLSNPSVLSSINILTQDARNTVNEKLIMESKNTIRILMNSDYLIRKFYRILYFNVRGDVISTVNYGDKALRTMVSIEDFGWYDETLDNKGELIVCGIHEDEWGKNTSPEIFSTIKKIQGENMGFFEVQVTREEMDRIFELPGELMNLCLIDEKGNILYCSDDKVNPDFYQQFTGTEKMITGEYDSDTGKRLAVGEYSEDGKIYAIVSEKASVVNRNFGNGYLPTILLVVGCLAVSLGYISITSKRLTRPIFQLQHMLQDTSLETLGDPVKLPESSDEFRKLGEAYSDMRQRLNEAIIRETQISVLQLKAQFDLLQAQVDPHFIYNVLNIISARGVQNDDEVVCDICDDLAWMLRYSTNTKKRYAAISEEMCHLNKYFSLLKYRYEEKLEYVIKVKEEIEVQCVPKIILQQLVENSILHGFQNTAGTMKIVVEGWEDNGRWYLRVRDNGEGFSEDVLEKLHFEIRKIKSALGTERSHVELEIGGMGLINIYARLYLLEQENTVFILGNWDSGAEILVGGRMKKVYCKKE